jgi:hypothetical protein
MAEREWDRVPQDTVPYYHDLITQLASHLDDPRGANTLRWTKLKNRGLQSTYGVDNLWAVRANRKYRVLLSRTEDGVELVGFRFRGDKDCYQ